MRHTQGPWKLDVYRAVNGDPCARVLSADGTTAIADCSFVVESYEKANANLIAAAPEMLEALLEIRAVLEESRKHSCAGFDCSYCNPAQLREVADNAIAKAVRS